MFVGLALQLTGLILSQQPGLMTELMNGFGESLFASLPLLAIGIWLPSLAGILLLLRPVRSLLARILPIDPDSPVDAVALSLSMLIVINLMVTLGVGLDNLAKLLAAEEGADDGSATIAMLWIQQLMMALTAAIGVGWLTRRRWGDTLVRLGLVLPTGRQVAIGLSVGLVLVPMVVLLEYLASLLGVQADQDVERLTEELLGALFETPWGIVTLGLAAALGEEPLFRGAAQPKFGLILTALLFALLHSNYGITLSTGIVFLLGLILGLLRIRHNTSTAMIAHAVYNISLGLMAYFSISLLEP
jgi:membrane protease YdiL (CAAX protease family)